MASILIRKLDETTKRKLRTRAASNGRSMEEEARQILKNAVRVKPAPAHSLGEAIRKRFEAIGGWDFEQPPREPMREPPDFK